MKYFQIFVVILPLICLYFQGTDANPMQVSNVDCAGEYMTCLDRENESNPMGMQTVAKTCRAHVRKLEICSGMPAYRSEDNIALK